MLRSCVQSFDNWTNMKGDLCDITFIEPHETIAVVIFVMPYDRIITVGNSGIVTIIRRHLHMLSGRHIDIANNTETTL
jgi:hypothetical protein